MANHHQFVPLNGPPKGNVSKAPTVELLLRGCDAGKWARSHGIKPGKTDDVADDDLSPRSKKSVIAKVREKAKQWMNITGTKKKNTLMGDKTAMEDNESVHKEEEEVVEDPEYLGAPMYESKMAPERYQENARQRPRAHPVISENHLLPKKTVCNHSFEQNSVMANAPITPPPGSDQVARALPQPSHVRDSTGEDVMGDEAMAARKASDDVGVVGKVKEAVTSFFKQEKTCQSIISSQSFHVDYQDEDEKFGRILQAN